MFSLTLDKPLNQDNVSHLREVFLEFLSKVPDGLPVQLLFAPDCAFDASGLQLLLAFWHAATERGCEVMLQHLPDALHAILRSLDLHDRFTVVPA